MGAIDYIKGTIDDSSTWQSFEVLAAADGFAVWDDDPKSGYGNMVLIRHAKTDLSGKRYFTLYAHLKPGTIPVHIPKLGRHNTTFSQWVEVKAGELIGTAGQTGKVRCNSANCIHLHFEVFADGYFLNQTDAYRVFKKRAFYPGPCSTYLWTVCPPTSPPTPTNLPPTAGFTMTSIPLQPVPNGQTLSLTVQPGGSASVVFDGSAPRSSDPDGTVTGWQWKVNGVNASTASSFTRALSAGTHSISLVATDNLGLASTEASGTVVVTESTPLPVSVGGTFLYYRTLSDLQSGYVSVRQSSVNIDESQPLLGMFTTGSDPVVIDQNARAQVLYSRQQPACSLGTIDPNIELVISSDQSTRARLFSFRSFEASAGGELLAAHSTALSQSSIVLSPNTTYYVSLRSSCPGDELSILTDNTHQRFAGYIVVGLPSLPKWTRVYPAQQPSPRWGFSMAYDEARGQVVMFGGCIYTDSIGNCTMTDETWLWEDGNWSKRSKGLLDSTPPASVSFVMAYDALRQRIVLFGGGTSGLGSDTWLWDGNTWLPVARQGTWPQDRGSHSLAYDWGKGEVVLQGGVAHSSTGRFFWDDTWLWNGVSWLERLDYLSQLPGGPPARAAMAWDSVSRSIVSFGGRTISCGGGCYGPIVLDDTWKWNGSTWEQLLPSPAVRPFRKQGHAMAIDPTSNKVLLVGGSSLLEPVINGRVQTLSDTWIWTGVGWLLAAPANRLLRTPEGAFGVAPDLRNKQVVLFTTPEFGVSETWVWK